MPYNQQELERQERLVTFFLSNQKIWDDLVEEINICIKNSQYKLQGPNTDNRDWYAGYISAMSFILSLEDYYKKLELKKDEVQ